MRLNFFHILIVICNLQFCSVKRLVFIIKIMGSQAAFETCFSSEIFLKKINLSGFVPRYMCSKFCRFYVEKS